MSEEIRSLDATAQAELVAGGEVSPEELVEIAVGRAEEVNPEINAIIGPLYEEGKAAAAGDLPDGPFRGVPFLFKDLGAGLASAAVAPWAQGIEDSGLRRRSVRFQGRRDQAEKAETGNAEEVSRQAHNSSFWADYFSSF